MGVIGNYKEYKKYYPQYIPFDKKDKEQEAKRASYLQKHPEIEKPEDKKRAKAILDAIEIMDDYSQSKAEDMENTVNVAKSTVVSLSVYPGMLLGACVGLLINKFRGKNDYIKAAAAFSWKALLPGFIGTIALPALLSIGFSCFSAKKELEASRIGRMEAMTKDLANPAQFAVLTEEQEEQVEKLAQNIDSNKIKKEKKKLLKWHPFKSLKVLFEKENAEYEKGREKFDEVLYLQEKKRRQTPNLTEKQINDAKRDKQILSTMVRKIDIASQEYSENVEYSTNVLSAVVLAGGFLAGAISNKIIKLLGPVKDTVVGKLIPFVVSGGLILSEILISSKLKKQSSRVGRFKAKQEILKNPENYIYIDDEKLKEEKDVKIKSKKNTNIFSSLIDVWNDTKEYENYQKKHSEKIAKRKLAKEQIKLTKEQENEAKTLQHSVFMTFDKVDEKSQKYSESVEAVGEIVNQIASIIPVIGVTVSQFMMIKSSGRKGKLGSILAILGSFGVPFAFNYYVTQEQKKASKVADMKALQELDDYKNYVNYDSK